MKCSHCDGTGEEPTNGKAVAKRERDVLFETVANVCGIDWRKITPALRGPLNSALAGIRPVWDGSTQQVYRKANEYRRRMPDCELTPKALEKWWPMLNGNPATIPGSLGSTLRAAAELLEEGR